MCGSRRYHTSYAGVLCVLGLHTPSANDDGRRSDLARKFRNRATCLRVPIPPSLLCTPVPTTIRQAARIVLGKFEVILRQDCLSTDLALLRPYLGAGGTDDRPRLRTRRGAGTSETVATARGFKFALWCLSSAVHSAIDRQARARAGEFYI